MDCARFESIVHEIERPGTEGFALRENAYEHAESCDCCARLLTETESLDAGLRAVMAAASAQEAPPRVETELLAEMRRQKAALVQRRVRRQVAALSTAAVALLAAGLSLHYWKGSGGGSNRPAPPAENPAQANGAAATGTPNVIDVDDSAYASSFRALPYADDPSALEDGAVVRVEMPRAALASFGLPVAAMESGDGTVRADLIVSADGTPEAIRLVPQNGASSE